MGNGRPLSREEDLLARQQEGFLSESSRNSDRRSIVVAVEEYVARRSKRSEVRGLATEVAERHRELLDRLAQ